MARLALPIENLDAIIRDVSEALQTLKAVADSMRECGSSRWNGRHNRHSLSRDLSPVVDEPGVSRSVRPFGRPRHRLSLQAGEPRRGG